MKYFPSLLWILIWMNFAWLITQMQRNLVSCKWTREWQLFNNPCTHRQWTGKLWFDNTISLIQDHRIADLFKQLSHMPGLQSNAKQLFINSTLFWICVRYMDHLFFSECAIFFFFIVIAGADFVVVQAQSEFFIYRRLSKI